MSGVLYGYKAVLHFGEMKSKLHLSVETNVLKKMSWAKNKADQLRMLWRLREQFLPNGSGGHFPRG